MWLLDKYSKYFKNGDIDLGGLIKAHDIEFSLAIKEQMRFWKNFGIEDKGQIAKYVREHVEKTMSNYFAKSKHFKDL